MMSQTFKNNIQKIFRDPIPSHSFNIIKFRTACINSDEKQFAESLWQVGQKYLLDPWHEHVFGGEAAEGNLIATNIPNDKNLNISACVLGLCCKNK